MKNTNKHELAVELVETAFRDIVGTPLKDFPDTPLISEIFDRMEGYIDKFGNDEEKLKSTARILVCSHMGDILAGEW